MSVEKEGGGGGGAILVATDSRPKRMGGRGEGETERTEMRTEVLRTYCTAQSKDCRREIPCESL